MFRTLQWNVGTLWCKLAHGSVMWPVHGKYECGECGRLYPAFVSSAVASQPAETALQPRVTGHSVRTSFGQE